MRSSWKLPDEEVDLGAIREQRLSAILLEFDGPELMVFTEGTKQVLAVASDRDADVVRWVQAQISERELISLREGRMPILEALAKEVILVVDRDADLNPLKAWILKFNQLDESVDLPDPTVSLPVVPARAIAAT